MRSHGECLYIYEYTHNDNDYLTQEDRHRIYETNTNQWTNIRRYEYTKDNKLESVYSGNTLLVSYTYDGDGTITSSLDRDLDLNQNLNIHDINYINSLTNNQRQLINQVSSNDSFLYELTEYITDKNRTYSETLMERDGTGQLSTIYTYGNQRINSESYNNLSGLYTYDGRGSVSAVIGGYGDFRASYWYDGLGNVKIQIHGYGAFGSGKKYYGYNAEQYNPVTGNQNLRARQLNIRRQRFLTEDTFIGIKNNPLSINRYIYANSNPLKYKDPDGFVPRIIVNKNKKNNGNEPFNMIVNDKVYFVRNGAKPVFSINGDNYYEVSDKIKVISGPVIIGINDDDQYAGDNFYQYTSYITKPHPNTRFIPRQKNQMVNASLMVGLGFGGSVKILKETGLKVKYGIERDLFYDHEFRRVLNLEEKIMGTGVSFKRDYANNKIDNSFSLYNFTENSNDIVFSFGAEFYFVIGGGGEIRVNLSEICRRIKGLFNGGCKR